MTWTCCHDINFDLKSLFRYNFEVESIFKILFIFLA